MDVALDGDGHAAAAAAAAANGEEGYVFEGAYSLWLALRGRAEAAIDAGTRARARHQLMAAVASGDVGGLGLLLEKHGAIARAEVRPAAKGEREREREGKTKQTETETVCVRGKKEKKRKERMKDGNNALRYGTARASKAHVGQLKKKEERRRRKNRERTT
jgi:hypothetical protein